MAKRLKIDGVEVPLEKMDEFTQDVLARVYERVNTISEGLPQLIENAVGPALEKSIAPAVEKALEGKLPKPEDKKGGGGGGEDTPAADALAAALKPLQEKLDALERERGAEKTAATAREIAKAHIDEKFPNLKEGAKKRLEARLVAGAPKDKAAAETLAKSVLEEWADAAGGQTVEQFLGSNEDTGGGGSGGGGGKGGGSGGGGGDEVSTEDRIKQINSTPRPGTLKPVGAAG